MKLKSLSILLTLAMMLGLLTACSEKEEVTIEADPNPTTVNLGLIMGPPSMGLGYLLNEAAEGNTYNDYNVEVAGIDYAYVAAMLGQGDFDIATLPSNIAPILYNNEDLNEDFLVISIGNLGVLYVLTCDPDIQSMEDLAGKTVYSIGEGGTPEYTFDYVLDQTGLLDEVNFSFRSTPFEILTLLLDEPGAVALLPQPFVEVAKLLVPGLLIPIDITDVWNSFEATNGAEAITTVTVVRKDFLLEHEQAVLEYLELSKLSTDYCLENLEEAAAWTMEFETFLDADIAAEAIPSCSIVTITGEEMREMFEPFIQIMYDLNPDAVGGAMPGDDFYYIPPTD